MSDFWSFNIGHVITLGLAAVGGIWAFAKASSSLDVIVARFGQFDQEMANFDKRLEKLAQGIDKLAEIAIDIARQHERLDAMDKRLGDQSSRQQQDSSGLDERLRRLEMKAQDGPHLRSKKRT